MDGAKPKGRVNAWIYCLSECRKFRLGCALNCRLRQKYLLPPYGPYPGKPLKAYPFNEPIPREILIVTDKQLKG